MRLVYAEGRMDKNEERKLDARERDLYERIISVVLECVTEEREWPVAPLNALLAAVAAVAANGHKHLTDEPETIKQQHAAAIRKALAIALNAWGEKVCKEAEAE